MFFFFEVRSIYAEFFMFFGELFLSEFCFKGIFLEETILKGFL